VYHARRFRKPVDITPRDGRQFVDATDQNGGPGTRMGGGSSDHRGLEVPGCSAATALPIRILRENDV